MHNYAVGAIELACKSPNRSGGRGGRGRRLCVHYYLSSFDPTTDDDGDGDVCYDITALAHVVCSARYTLVMLGCCLPCERASESRDRIVLQLRLTTQKLGGGSGRRGRFTAVTATTTNTEEEEEEDDGRFNTALFFGSVSRLCAILPLAGPVSLTHLRVCVCVCKVSRPPSSPQRSPRGGGAEDDVTDDAIACKIR